MPLRSRMVMVGPSVAIALMTYCQPRSRPVKRPSNRWRREATQPFFNRLGQIEQSVFTVPASDKLHTHRQARRGLPRLHRKCWRMERGGKRDPIEKTPIRFFAPVHIHHAIGKAALLIVGKRHDRRD